MFLAGETGTYRWKTYKQREKQPADKRRSQATQETCPTFHPGTIGLSSYRELHVGGRVGDLITAPNYHQKKEKERKMGRERETKTARQSVCECEGSSLLLDCSIRGGKPESFSW